jgi:beta-1,2-mannobiose phosphorylase / 1,2-beta-oligomannan phosphorylase
MKTLELLFLLLLFLVLPGHINGQKASSTNVNNEEFPGEMVAFVPYGENPVFKATGIDTWDKMIRERGYILFEDGVFKLWYTGYNGPESVTKYLGYATSDDGINWKRYPGNPIFNKKWTEDMFVIKNEGKYYMYAEGKNDVAHLLTSNDGIKWQEEGDLKILKVNGDTIPGPYGTPNVVIDNGKWYLFYECNDLGVWLATSNDHKNWKNIQDEPVLKKGPEKYDARMIASNQVVKYKNRYYIYYHGLPERVKGNPSSPEGWTSNVAMSTDLIHWIKYPMNPIVAGDHSSPVLVFDGKKYRLYTMHPAVCLYFSK